nr:MAG TPA: hypothetical protein [Caudoviricetes sp.]
MVLHSSCFSPFSIKKERTHLYALTVRLGILLGNYR